LSDHGLNNYPTVRKYSQQLQVEDNELSIFLSVIEYSNAIQIAIYDHMPTLGSMSFGYVDGDLTQHLEIFTGKHNQFSNALALILAKRTNKIIYASVNLSNESVVDLNMIKGLLDKYLQDLNQ
jgi:hypothetical protein